DHLVEPSGVSNLDLCHARRRHVTSSNFIRYPNHRARERSTADAGGRPARMSSPFRSLGVFNYRLWFAGATVSNVGTWMQRTAQDWIGLSELTDHDGLAGETSSELQSGQVLLITPLTGLAAAVFDRRRLHVASQTAMDEIGAVFAGLVVTG